MVYRCEVIVKIRDGAVLRLKPNAGFAERRFSSKSDIGFGEIKIVLILFLCQRKSTLKMQNRPRANLFRTNSTTSAFFYRLA